MELLGTALCKKMDSTVFSRHLLGSCYVERGFAEPSRGRLGFGNCVKDCARYARYSHKSLLSNNTMGVA